MFPRSSWEIDRGNVTVDPLFPGPYVPRITMVDKGNVTKMNMGENKGTMTKGPKFPGPMIRR